MPPGTSSVAKTKGFAMNSNMTSGSNSSRMQLNASNKKSKSMAAASYNVPSGILK